MHKLMKNPYQLPVEILVIKNAQEWYNKRYSYLLYLYCILYSQNCRFLYIKMNKRRNPALFLIPAIIILLGVPAVFSGNFRFITGAVFMNIGYFFQDSGSITFNEQESPAEILKAVLERNHLSSIVRNIFPRTAHHPKVGIVTCMDSRLHTEELVGDTRGYYYVLRTAGSAIDLKEIEMLELAISNGVQLVLFTTHSDCAAEKAANSDELKSKFPELTKAVLQRDQRYTQFLERPDISSKIASGQLIVKRVNVDTLGGGALDTTP